MLCTYLNGPYAKTCNICGGPRPVLAPGVSGGGSTPASPVVVEDDDVDIAQGLKESVQISGGGRQLRHADGKQESKQADDENIWACSSCTFRNSFGQNPPNCQVSSGDCVAL